MAVEPPALAGGKKNGTEKSECRRAIYFFNFAPLRGVKILSNRNKAKCRRCTRKFLRKIAKYSHGKKGKKPC